MKKTYRIPVALFAALGLLAAVAAYAHEMDCGDQGGRKHHRMMKYDPKTVETITGEVVKVKEFTHRRGTGIGLVLKTDKEEIPIHIGPSSFLEIFRDDPRGFLGPFSESQLVSAILVTYAVISIVIARSRSRTENPSK